MRTGKVTLFRWWRKKNETARDRGAEFPSELRITESGGWVSLELLLENRSTQPVWIDDVQLALTDLAAQLQTSEPNGQGLVSIQHNIRPRDFFRLSLAEALYDAAGKPQRSY